MMKNKKQNEQIQRILGGGKQKKKLSQNSKNCVVSGFGLLK